MGTITRGLANSITTGGKVVSTSLSGTVAAPNVNNESLDSVTAFSSSLGDFVETRASDLSASPTTRGQLFYNSTAGALKGIRLGTASWASGGSLPAGRQNAGQAGTQTAAILAGGQPPSTYNTNTSYTYDGSSWTSTPNLGTERREANMFGIQTAAVLAASTKDNPRSYLTASEEWNGSSWTAGGAINTGRQGAFGGGTLTQGVIAGGSGPSYSNATEEYDGSSWTTVTNMPAAQGNGTSGADSQLDMSCVGGGPGTQTTHAIYNGTSWSAGNSLSGAGRRGNRGAMPSSSSLGFTAGGESATVNPITVTEEWNGTSFSSSTAIPAATRDAASSDGGTGEAGLFSGGNTGSITANTFEWTGSQQTLKTITTA